MSFFILTILKIDMDALLDLYIFHSAFVQTPYFFNGVEKTSIVKSKFSRSALAPSLIFMDRLYTKST